MTKKTENENSVISNLFSELKFNQIDFVLLSDFESEGNTGDVDIYVPLNHKYKFECTLSKLGWYERKEGADCVVDYFYYHLDSELYLHIKYELVFAESFFRAWKYNFSEEVLESKVYNQFGVPRPYGIHLIILYLAKTIINTSGKLDVAKRKKIKDYLFKHKIEFQGEKEFLFAERLYELLKKKDVEVHLLSKLIKAYFTINIRMIRRLKIRRTGAGINVLFLGTDGSGKTTLINNIQNSMQFKVSNLYLGMGEQGWKSKGVKKLQDKKINIDSLNQLKNMFYGLLALPLELLIRRLDAIKTGKSRIFLIDRFPGFPFISSSKTYSKLYSIVLPKPDIVIFLYGNPEILVKRKSELTIERAIRDLEKFEKVADKISDSNYISINTTEMTIDESMDIIKEIILKHPKIKKNLLKKINI
ncbi:nucleoside/nucleotide kinase family protein [Salimicrobium humidisoli]|uniref:Thymidylate kinase n=1 Tax=Salimicrobium humidisoli TaxID=2029857 RepID=A0ABX4HUT9_9BACI|nr:AAA family ATPase [Salimicrobium humidisoli]PBB06460.1 hypothetical protein CKW00_03790 [Salimicrobium humidisoli]